MYKLLLFFSISVGLFAQMPCIDLYEPVCGSDNHTYSNACFAIQSGVSTYVQGACRVESNCELLNSPVCGSDNKTYLSACRAQESGVITYTPGYCISNCVGELNPVCANNGNTYSNACTAEQEGIYNYTLGACAPVLENCLKSVNLINYPAVTVTHFKSYDILGASEFLDGQRIVLNSFSEKSGQNYGLVAIQFGQEIPSGSKAILAFETGSVPLYLVKVYTRKNNHYNTLVSNNNDLTSGVLSFNIPNSFDELRVMYVYQKSDSNLTNPANLVNLFIKECGN